MRNQTIELMLVVWNVLTESYFGDKYLPHKTSS